MKSIWSKEDEAYFLSIGDKSGQRGSKDKKSKNEFQNQARLSPSRNSHVSVNQTSSHHLFQGTRSKRCKEAAALSKRVKNSASRLVDGMYRSGFISLKT